MIALCIDDDFTDFLKANPYSYFNLPIYGHGYEIRGDNGKGGITLQGLNNPYFAISLNPLLFEELHFAKERFAILDNEYSVSPPYIVNYN